NSGMFVWSVETFLAQARRCEPALAQFIESYPKDPVHAATYLREQFPALPKNSVDRAILERASDVWMLPARFDWDDVGSWTAFPRHLSCDEQGNAIAGSSDRLVALHDARNNVVIANGTPIALCGVENLVVVQTPDALLVCHQDAAQKLKGLLGQMPEELR